jgi:hypothetical protein
MNVFVTAALAGLHRELRRSYSDTGWSSVDPELMTRALACALFTSTDADQGTNQRRSGSPSPWTRLRPLRMARDRLKSGSASP